MQSDRSFLPTWSDLHLALLPSEGDDHSEVDEVGTETAAVEKLPVRGATEGDLQVCEVRIARPCSLLHGEVEPPAQVEASHSEVGHCGRHPAQ